MTMLLLSPFITWLIMWIIGGSIFGFATNAIIRNKGYEENWFWWGFFFGLIAMLVAMSKPERSDPNLNNTNTIVDNTLLGKDSKVENNKEEVLEIPIIQYNHASKLKPCSLICSPHQGQYAFVIKLKCFREKEITDVMIDIVLYTTFGEALTIKDIGFTNFEGTKYSRVSGMTEYPLPQAQFILIKQADIIIKKYVEGGKVVELSKEEMKLKPYEEPLEEELQEQARMKELILERKARIKVLILAVENLKTCSQIYDYLLKYNVMNNNVMPEKLLEMAKDRAYIEQMHGETSRRTEVWIREIKKCFEENGMW